MLEHARSVVAIPWLSFGHDAERFASGCSSAHCSIVIIFMTTFVTSTEALMTDIILLLSLCVGWTGNGFSAACFKCLWCRCKIRGSGVPGCVRSHIVVRTCEMMKVVASATCFLESSNRRFESVFIVPHLRTTGLNRFCFHCDSRSYISLLARHGHIVVL